MPVVKKKVRNNGTTTSTKSKAGSDPIDQELKKLETNVSLDERLKRFEELRGLNNKRDSVNGTLAHLHKFNFGQNDSCSLVLQDQAGQQFSTTNTNLINLLSTNLQQQLEAKKKELEEKILTFKF